jgi:hypothetical protein
MVLVGVADASLPFSENPQDIVGFLLEIVGVCYIIMVRFNPLFCLMFYVIMLFISRHGTSAPG